MESDAEKVAEDQAYLRSLLGRIKDVTSWFKSGNDVPIDVEHLGRVSIRKIADDAMTLDECADRLGRELSASAASAKRLTQDGTV